MVWKKSNIVIPLAESCKVVIVHDIDDKLYRLGIDQMDLFINGFYYSLYIDSDIDSDIDSMDISDRSLKLFIPKDIISIICKMYLSIQMIHLMKEYKYDKNDPYHVYKKHKSYHFSISLDTILNHSVILDNN